MTVQRLSSSNDQPVVVRRGEDSFFSKRPKKPTGEQYPIPQLKKRETSSINVPRTSAKPAPSIRQIVKVVLLAFFGLAIAAVFDKSGTTGRILSSLMGIAWNLVFFAILGVVLIPSLKKKMQASSQPEIKAIMEKLQQNAKKPKYND